MSVFSKPISASQLSAIATKSDVTAAVEEVLAGLVPTAYPGTVQLFRGATVPAGWARISGIQANADLYSVPRITLLSFTPGATGSAQSLYTACWAVTPLGLHTLNVSASGAHRVYDPGLDAWSAKSLWPGTVAGTCAVGVGAQMFAYCMTGANTSAFSYSTETGSWITRTALPAARAQVGLIANGSTEVLLVGGRTTSALTPASTFAATVWSYDIAGNTYTAKASAPVSLAVPRCVQLRDGSGRVFVTSRVISVDGSAVVTTNRRCWLYAAITDSWLEVDPLPEAVDVAGGGTLQASGSRVIYIPQIAPATGARGRIFDAQAVPGQQWSDFVISAPTSVTAANADYYQSCGDGLVLASGLRPTQLGAGTANALFVGLSLEAPESFGGNLFYAKKL